MDQIISANLIAPASSLQYTTLPSLVDANKTIRCLNRTSHSHFYHLNIFSVYCNCSKVFSCPSNVESIAFPRFPTTWLVELIISTVTSIQLTDESERTLTAHVD